MKNFKEYLFEASVKKSPEIYAAELTHHSRTNIKVGTLKALADYVSYTLECGHSWNPKIKTAENIKTVDQLQKAYDMSIEETQGSSYEQDSAYFREATSDELEFYLHQGDGEDAVTYKK